ncbi:MAG: hypothetical protein K2Q45_00640 [Nitrosomonas sp.]|nr:hypothetical protein [Nitrosomonas sp.]
MELYHLLASAAAGSTAASSYPRDLCERLRDSSGGKQQDQEKSEKRGSRAGIKIGFWSFMDRYFAFC